jgi:hypothetical protein
MWGAHRGPPATLPSADRALTGPSGRPVPWAPIGLVVTVVVNRAPSPGSLPIPVG